MADHGDLVPGPGRGHFTSSLIARATSVGADSTGSNDRVLEVYTNVGALAVAIGVAVLMLTPLLRRMSRA